ASTVKSSTLRGLWGPLGFSGSGGGAGARSATGSAVGVVRSPTGDELVSALRSQPAPHIATPASKREPLSGANRRKRKVGRDVVLLGSMVLSTADGRAEL